MENINTYLEFLLQDVNDYLQLFWQTVTFEFFIKFAIVYFFIIWIALLVWVIKDISIRTNNVFLQIFSVLIPLFLTPLWIFIYLIIRPWKTLYEKYYDEVEQNLQIFNDLIDDKKKELEINRRVEERLSELTNIDVIEKNKLKKEENTKKEIEILEIKNEEKEKQKKLKEEKRIKEETDKKNKKIAEEKKKLDDDYAELKKIKEEIKERIEKWVE